MNIDEFNKMIYEDYKMSGSYMKLAKKVGLSNTTLFAWVKEIKIAPDIENLKRYVNAIDCPPERKALYFESCGYPVPDEYTPLTADDKKGLEEKIRQFVKIETDEIWQAVPVAGNVHAEVMTSPNDNVDGTINTEKKYLKDCDNHFWLRVVGDCMNLAGIQEGSLALISVGRLPENGQIAVFMYEGETIIRKFVRKNDVIMLQPVSSNPVHQPIIITPKDNADWTAIGVVRVSLMEITK